MRKFVTTALLAGSLLVGCGTSSPVTLVEKEYEPAGFGTHSKCEKRDKKTGKCTKAKKSMKYEPECFELEWSNGDEECVTREQFDSVQLGQVRS